MISFINYLALAFIGLSLQAVLFTGVKPDIVVVLVCFYTLKYGQLRGVASGAAMGLIIDSASGFILGPNIFSKASTAFLFGMVRRKVFYWNRIMNTLMVAAVSLLDILMIRICLAIFMDISYSNRMLALSILQIVWTVAISLLMYPFFDPEKNERYGVV